VPASVKVKLIGPLLVQVKLLHWDLSIRMLASQALHELSLIAPAYMVEQVLPDLLGQVYSPDVVRRHGSILGVAEVIRGVANYPAWVPPDLVQAIVNIVPRIEKARLYTGRDGKLVRSAACRLIECIAISAWQLSIKMQVRKYQALQDSHVPT
jgi:tubulin-specific chaperone D